jgi:hypothetical protein
MWHNDEICGSVDDPQSPNSVIILVEPCLQPVLVEPDCSCGGSRLAGGQLQAGRLQALRVQPVLQARVDLHIPAQHLAWLTCIPASSSLVYSGGASWRRGWRPSGLAKYKKAVPRISLRVQLYHSFMSPGIIFIRIALSLQRTTLVVVL